MSKLIGLVNYGVAGNIRSIKKALDIAGAETVLIESKSDFDKIDKLVLPGVGSFPDAMKELEDMGLIESLKKEILLKPTLGICLGMQILSKIGFEFEETKGLGLFDAEVRPILCQDTVPHMGFNKISVQQESEILKGLEDQEFYFMHSFEVVNYRNILSLTSYSNHEFVSAIIKDNIFGVQFHPEKSRDQGIELFKNFIKL